MEPGVSLTAIEFEGWRQFARVGIEFHPRMTIVTGANGSGKTTLMHLLARLVGWQVPMVAQPPLERVGAFLAGIWGHMRGRTGDPSLRTIGTVTIGRATLPISLPFESQEETFQLTVGSGETIDGIYIPSHRPLYMPTRAAPIRGSIHPEDLYEEYVARTRPQWTGESRSDASPLSWLKSALVYIDRESFPLSLPEFSNLLAHVLPPSLRFSEIERNGNDIIIRTHDGYFAIDAVSGGIAAMIDIVWQIYSYGFGRSSYAVLIDEPENHLHPAMQRVILPRLIEAFPSAQFIVSTHSPLIVTSVEDANVYALVYASDVPDDTVGRITSESIPQSERVGTANETLKSVLGVGYTMPDWAAETMHQLIRRFAKDPTPESLDTLEGELMRRGLDAYVPSVLLQADDLMTAAEEDNRARRVYGDDDDYPPVMA